jgi:hypothetical protein
VLDKERISWETEFFKTQKTYNIENNENEQKVKKDLNLPCTPSV